MPATCNAGYEFTLFRGARIALDDARAVELSAPVAFGVALGAVVVYALGVAAALRTRAWRPRALACARAHHAALSVYSAACCGAVAWHLVASGEAAEWAAWVAAEAAAPGAGGAPRLVCAPVPAWLRAVSLSFIASKVWEWGDTAVLVAKGQSARAIGTLHLFHHATTLPLFLITTSLPVTEKLGLLLNGGVHALMYAHFAFRLPRALRPLITALQIAQLATVTHAWFFAAARCEGAAPYAAQNAATFFLPALLVPSYLLLFVQFFCASYVGAAAKGAKVSAKERAE